MALLLRSNAVLWAAVALSFSGCAGTGTDQGGGDDGGSSADASNCTVPNTPANCGTCGVACDMGMSVQSAQCSAPDAGPAADAGQAFCTYACAAGFTDCNAKVLPSGEHAWQQAPDFDGCECPTPNVTNATCCNGSAAGQYGQCPIAHVYDTSMSNTDFYDCEPQGSYSNRLALDACVAFAGNGQCDNTVVCNNGTKMACSSGPGASTCNCWSYEGPNSGLVSHGSKGNCPCTGPKDAPYN